MFYGFPATRRPCIDLDGCTIPGSGLFGRATYGVSPAIHVPLFPSTHSTVRVRNIHPIVAVVALVLLIVIVATAIMLPPVGAGAGGPLIYYSY